MWVASAMENEAQVLALDKENDETILPSKIPKDKYVLCHLVFFALGTLHVLTISIFDATNDYWIYKFRNIPGNKAGVPAHFDTFKTAVNVIATILFGLLSINYGSRFKIVNRIKVSLVILVVTYCILIAFNRINTDNYQTGFFFIVMICWCTLTGANVTNIGACYSLFSRFPLSYMTTMLIGQGAAGVFSSSLNIIAVKAFDGMNNSASHSGLMQFVFCSFVVTLTLIMVPVASRTEFFLYCLDTMPEDHKAKPPKLKETRKILSKVKLTFVIFILWNLAVSACHTSVTSLVVSQQNKSTSIWADKYFTPVLTYLWPDCCGLVGRILASSPLQKLPKLVLYILTLGGSIILVPLIWFCNAQPRNHWTVLFPYDYQYAIILGIFFMIRGYLNNMAMFLIPKKTTKPESETVYNALSIDLALRNTSSPIGSLVAGFF